MRKRSIGIFAIIIGIFLVIGGVPWVCAQESAIEEFTLEEITVTAEKREVNVQDIPASVQAIAGADLVDEGKVTAPQMLESVPNLTFGELGRGGMDGSNISIRGVKKTQEPAGGSPVPPSTAFYVDDVYGGMGGTFDIERVEVLRGPQGTLYGRSATGGVVSFHTNDPRLEEFGADTFVEFGTADRLNTQGVLNVPIAEKIALRAAVHYLHQDEGYYNEQGGENETKEGRIKVLFQPAEKLSLLFSWSASRQLSYSGGQSQTLSGPNTVVYNDPDAYTAPNKGVPTKREQGSLEFNYDLDGSALTYIAAIHTTDNRGKSGIGLNRSSYQQNVSTGKPTKTGSYEIRWASDNPEGALTWLIGANYYKSTYDRITQTWQARDLNSDDPLSFNAPIFGQYNKGSEENYGIFTEETYELRDDFRITAGLRYDKTKILNHAGYDFNKNLGAFMVSFNPPDIIHYPPDATYKTYDLDFDNVTYKLRFEYDLTPDNMLYLLTATGFLPAQNQINIATVFSPPPDMQLLDVGFVEHPFKQQKLTSYEAGSKNRFLDNTLQVNSAVFYYDYEGYQEAVNVNPPGSPPPPNFVVLRVPVRMFGCEIDVSWLVTPYDKVTFSGGALDAQLKSYPNVPGSDPPQSAKDYMYLKEVPGLLSSSATLSYDHTFLFGDGSSLVPRGELRYSGGYYLGQATTDEAGSTDAAGNSYLDYLYQGSTVLFNIGATWTSPQGKYLATAFMRNALDEEYKTSATLPTGTPLVNVTLGDPRTWGLMFKVKF